MESVVALFREPGQAKVVLEALKSRGFDRDHLGFAMSDAVAEEDLAQSTGVSPEEGAPAGSAAVIRGGLMGVLASLTLTVPIWLLILVFPVTRIYQEGGLLGIMYGAIGGLTLGGLFGALSGSDSGDYVTLLRRMGVPPVQAERFNAGISDGHVIVIARDASTARADEALSLMRQHGAIKLDDAAGKGRLQSERIGQGGH